MSDFIPPERRAHFAELFAEVRRSRTARLFESHRTLPDGTTKFFESKCLPIDRGASGVGLLVVSSEVTERKRYEEALRASEQRFRALVERADALILSSAEGVITYANDPASRGLGFDPGEMVGKPSSHFIHPEDKESVGRELAKVRRTPGATVRIQFRAIRKDGAVRWLDAMSTNLLDEPQVRSIVATYRDIDERKRLEEQLRQSQKMEAIGLLAGGIAHDFNNLLGIVTGSVELAKRQVDAKGNPTANLDAIAGAAQRAAELTRKLLAFSKKQVLRVETFDLRDALGDFAGLLARVVGEDIELEVTPGDDPLPVRADVLQLEQVLLNLCTNARQAMPRGGRLVIATRRAGEHVELSVADSGVGMDAATRARVFEPFFTTRSEGTGLGLATVYGIVQQHDGAIEVESEPGRGTTFRVRLPIAGEPAPAPDAARNAPREARGGRETLLVAEDEPVLRSVMARMLSDLGYTVIAVPDGEAAAREFEQRRADIALVILDVVMPKLGGPEAYVRMRAVNPGVRVLFTTGYAPEAGAVSELVARGGHSLLDKPFRMQELAEKVRAALDG